MTRSVVGTRWLRSKAAVGSRWLSRWVTAVGVGGADTAAGWVRRTQRQGRRGGVGVAARVGGAGMEVGYGAAVEGNFPLMDWGR
ncbi:hypothetical protein GUJ93_ZPchr0002g26115 [Zizania palustris]|uniref:Uncharacterized protein n=1 Tax=Zizania palustris TaxID=103762 RepID=A0A8J5VHR4_ZIZPA|nr:hypothetical protein GUJ93_ZPchr0002g26115 [Zizania palustris]